MKITGEVKFLGDGYPGCYANGLSMIGSDTKNRFTLKEDNETETVYVTEDNIALKITHKVGKNKGVKVISTSISNHSDHDVTLEMMTSFMIEGIKADRLHKMLSFWSQEGKHKVDELVDLNLEKSWAGHGMRVHKFGNNGSMPVRGYFPFVALEDSENGEFIAVSLYSPSSWQIEVICHREDTFTLAGGIADRDYGQWMKVVHSGKTFTAPKAVVATGKSFLEVCDLLVKEQTPDISSVDDKMGITFNEYCTTWGDPTIENMKKIADKIAGKGIQYLVMDSGWYLEKGENWWNFIGRWEVNKKRFLDMESEKAKEFLKEKVIGLLKENGFGYIKIDYNDTIGMGCDGDESLGENLRKKVLASQDFFREIKKEIPDIVIENCSSGGHRLEPSMMELASMASFSDAHETLSIPLIAASLQTMVAPMQNQIWAVLRKEDSDERIYYSMISTFLGRMGLSGDIYDLSSHQWQLVEEGIAFYHEAADIIKNGRTVILQNNVHSWNNPCGMQLVVREYKNSVLAILHRFADQADCEFTIPDYIMKKGKAYIEYGGLNTEFSAKSWIYLL